MIGEKQRWKSMGYGLKRVTAGWSGINWKRVEIGVGNQRVSQGSHRKSQGNFWNLQEDNGKPASEINGLWGCEHL